MVKNLRIIYYIKIYMYANIIIIPYRNRKEHLDYFLKHSWTLIKEHVNNVKLVIVEQEEGKLFNRGKLLNVGFKEYQDKTEYFITHDVDMKPSLEVAKTVYTKEDIEMFRINSAHSLSLGGIIKAKHDIIFDINGFPNNIWGWGIEDRALYFKSKIKNINITNSDLKNNDFKILSHKSNAETYRNEKKIISDKWTQSHINTLTDIQKKNLINESGLNNLEYSVLERKEIMENVELIKVSI